MITCVGVIQMQQMRNAIMQQSLHAPLNSLIKCLTDTIHISNRAVITFPVDRSRDSV